LYKEIAGPKTSPFSYWSGRNVPFGELIKTTRPIFIYFKTGGDKNFNPHNLAALCNSTYI
jgi:hypothetical protein